MNFSWNRGAISWQVMPFCAAVCGKSRQSELPGETSHVRQHLYSHEKSQEG